MIEDVRYVQIRSMDVANGEYLGCSVFFQGCPFHCKGCFNKETWDMEGGKPWTSETTDEVLELVKEEHLKRISFLGGEPMIDRNISLLADLLDKIKDIRADITVWVYSGYVFESLLERAKSNSQILDVMRNIDYLVDGQFKEDLKDFKLRFRGSSNQRILDMKESMKGMKPVLDERLMELRE